MAADAVDKQVLQHDLHVLEQVIEDHENVCIAASKCPTDSTFPLYVYEPRKGSELFHHRRADIIDMREDSKDAISRELLPLSPQLGSVDYVAEVMAPGDAAALRAAAAAVGADEVVVALRAAGSTALFRLRDAVRLQAPGALRAIRELGAAERVIMCAHKLYTLDLDPRP